MKNNCKHCGNCKCKDHFESESTQDVIVNGNSVIEMLYNVLKYGFIGVKGE